MKFFFYKLIQIPSKGERMDNRFGTTSGMVIQTVMENGQEFCLAIDERGLYLTSANYLDKNLADPHRYSGSRATTKARLLALDLDPVRLAEANAHRIPVYTDEAKKKINPIKASKRGLRG